MDRFTAMAVFRRVVEVESFSAAAQDLGLSNAAVSKNVSELEADLGVRLLARTTRRMSVTEAGQAYYRRCVSVLDEIDEAGQEAAQLATTPRGNLKISAPMSFGLLHLSAALPRFLQRFPDINVELMLNDRFIDLVEEGIDVAFRAGNPLPDSGLISRQLFTVDRVICGTPEYFARCGIPSAPADLANHECLVYSLSSSPGEWHLTKDGDRQTVRASGRFTVNSSISIREALLAGLGLSLIPMFIVEQDIKAGRLRSVLDDWAPDAQAAYAVYSHRQYVPAKVRCFVDFLVEEFEAAKS